MGGAGCVRGSQAGETSFALVEILARQPGLRLWVGLRSLVNLCPWVVLYR